MRPPVPDVIPHRSRKSSFEQQWTDPRNTAPATFFLTRSDDKDSGDEDIPNESDTSKGSMYGVQSLEETVHQEPVASKYESDTESKPLINPIDNSQDSPDDNETEDVPPPLRRRSTLKPLDLLNPRPDSASLQPLSEPASSRPLTPLNLSNPGDPPSLPSSPKSISNQSLRHLDDISIGDDLSSQAVASEEEEEEVSGLDSDNQNQLIMPSIKMPSRRPFTERGKSMGRLKILVAGASGSGKTSLIKSIVQICDDIVHFDPFPSSVPSSPIPSQRRSSRPQTRTTQAYGMPTAVSEIYASTKPYPSWWSDLEDSRVLRRRKSLGDIVLERNICFVDTPANSLSRTGQTDTIIQYVNQQLLRATTSIESQSMDFQNLLAGNGGSQVDTVLYLISEDTLSTDIECIKKLCDLVNVIPVISKADLLSPDQISALKSSFNKQAEAASIKVFLLGSSELQSPFAVSSAHCSDDDVMEASTLMSPDYVQPLAPSELTLLVENMFDRDNLAWIRHSAAKKLTKQKPRERPRSAHRSPDSFQNSILSRNSSFCSDGIISLPSACSPSYTMARISDYTQHEEKLAQVHIAKWASDLQRSLQNERERYANIAKGDRAIWLTERLSECVVSGSLISIHQSPDSNTNNLLIRTPSQDLQYHVGVGLTPHDPLGVVWWTDDLKRRGWIAVQLVGSFGVLGGLALWFTKTGFGLSSRNLAEWRWGID